MQQVADDVVIGDMETGVMRKDIQVLIGAAFAPANTLSADSGDSGSGNSQSSVVSKMRYILPVQITMQA